MRESQGGCVCVCAPTQRQQTHTQNTPLQLVVSTCRAQWSSELVKKREDSYWCMAMSPVRLSQHRLYSSRASYVHSLLLICPFLLPFPLPPNGFVSFLNGSRSIPPCVSFLVSLFPDHFWLSFLVCLCTLPCLLSVSFPLLEVLSLLPNDVLRQPLSLQRLCPLPSHHFLSSLPDDLLPPHSPSLVCSPGLQAVLFNSPSV